ncbi:MAG: heavy-metal-associated domain-containing protein [bacterium]
MCVRSVRAGITSVKGVKAVEVSLENGTAKVLCKKNVKPEQLINAVKEAGYKAKLSKEQS